MTRTRILTRATALAATLAGALAMLHLWAAGAAPVVRWSDSEIDLALARSPLAALAAAPLGHHPIKPAFIIFLKLCLLAAGSHDVGRVVVMANALLWLAAVAAGGVLVGRISCRAAGWGFVVMLLAMLRFRDNASAVMSETLAGAILLVVVASILALPRIRVPAAVLLALALSVLFWTRPNVGAVAIVLTAVLGWRKRSGKSAVTFAAMLVVINGGVWAATRPARSAATLRGLDYPIALGSIDDAWEPQLGEVGQADDSARAAGERLRFARRSWGRLMAQGVSADALRQWSWRAAHGLVGVDYYDASWSRRYQRLDAASRAAGVVVVLAGLSILLAGGAPAGVERGAGLFLIGAVIAQNLVFFSEPRLAAPYVPAILLLAIRALPYLTARRVIAAGGVLLALVVCCAWKPSVLGWSWGRIESSGVVLAQRIPRGDLPRRLPATFHLRLASPLPQSGANFSAALGGTVVYRSDADPCRARPSITIALSDEIVRLNRGRDVELSVTSFGRFDATSYLLFPVIPPPWRPGAQRTGSEVLSPSTGMVSGALDWWAHEGADEIPCPAP